MGTSTNGVLGATGSNPVTPTKYDPDTGRTNPSALAFGRLMPILMPTQFANSFGGAIKASRRAVTTAALWTNTARRLMTVFANRMNACF